MSAYGAEHRLGGSRLKKSSDRRERLASWRYIALAAITAAMIADMATAIILAVMEALTAVSIAIIAVNMPMHRYPLHLLLQLFSYDEHQHRNPYHRE